MRVKCIYDWFKELEVWKEYIVSEEKQIWKRTLFVLENWKQYLSDRFEISEREF